LSNDRWTKRQPGRGLWTRLRAILQRRPVPLYVLILAHVLALGIALVLYALPHHVIPRQGVAIGVTSSRSRAAQGIQPTDSPVPEEEAVVPVSAEVELPVDAEPTPEPVQEAVAEEVGNFRQRLAGHFTDGGVERTETTYRSANLDISISSEYVDAMHARAYVADIYIADISCIETVFAKDTFGRGYTEWLPNLAERTQSVVALNGDYYGTRDSGVVIRNGELFRNNKVTQDVAILYWNGEFETFSPEEFDAMTEMERGAYQSWCFGPMLVDDEGNALQGFNAAYEVIKKHPRSAIGYYEPGHYCFVAVDGRNKESKGATMHQLSHYMADLGCKRAYNLDGGQTSLLCAGTVLVNQPADGGRNTSDAIIVVDRVTPIGG